MPDDDRPAEQTKPGTILNAKDLFLDVKGLLPEVVLDAEELAGYLAKEKRFPLAFDEGLYEATVLLGRVRAMSTTTDARPFLVRAIAEALVGLAAMTAADDAVATHLDARAAAEKGRILRGRYQTFNDDKSRSRVVVVIDGSGDQILYREADEPEATGSVSRARWVESLNAGNIIFLGQEGA